jgi:hypothetical protein
VGWEGCSPSTMCQRADINEYRYSPAGSTPPKPRCWPPRGTGTGMASIAKFVLRGLSQDSLCVDPIVLIGFRLRHPAKIALDLATILLDRAKHLLDLANLLLD